MILASLIIIWCGLAMLYTLALCQVASGPTPSPASPHINRHFSL